MNRFFADSILANCIGVFSSAGPLQTLRCNCNSCTLVYCCGIN